VSVLYSFAQSTISGSVIGTVTDPSSAVVKAATVTLENVATKLSLSTTTNSEGGYRFDFVPEWSNNSDDCVGGGCDLRGGAEYRFAYKETIINLGFLLRRD
jgi:hypothetical protein